MICSLLFPGDLAFLSRTSRAIRQATIRPFFQRMKYSGKPSALVPFCRPGNPLSHPCLEHVTHLRLSAVDGGGEPYPAVSIPSLTHLHFDFTYYHTSISYDEVFAKFADLLPILNPTDLAINANSLLTVPDKHSRTLLYDSTASWTRLAYLVLVGHLRWLDFEIDFEGDPAEDEVENLKNYLDAYDNNNADFYHLYRLVDEWVVFLYGLRLLEKHKPKVVFDWYFLKNMVAGEDSIRRLKRGGPLVELPSWAKFEFVLSEESTCVPKVTKWLAKIYPAKQIQDRITVTGDGKDLKGFRW